MLDDVPAAERETAPAIFFSPLALASEGFAEWGPYLTPMNADV
jgi:hypothetical protein